MSDEQMAELRREMDFILVIIEKAREEDRDSIIQFHRSFGEFRVQLADHFAKDIARDKEIANLVKTITVDNGRPCVLSRVRTLEELNKTESAVDSTRMRLVAKILLAVSMAPGLFFTIMQILKEIGWIK